MSIILYFHCVEPDEIADIPLFLTFCSSRVPWLHPERSDEVCQVAVQTAVGHLGTDGALSAKWRASL